MSMKHERHILQNLEEFYAFGNLIKEEGASSYLEIGSKNGGSLWRISAYLKPGSRMVSVDLPHGDQSFKHTLPNLEACIKALKENRFDAHLIIGDSTDPSVVKKVQALGPFDVCFIDGNHTLPFITKDWQNYGPLAKIVAFHDIGFHREGGQSPHKMPINAPEFWKDLKKDFRHVEIRKEPVRVEGGKRCCDNGIGVLWH